MDTFTPNFPPVLLEKCLDFSKYIAEKTGKATLEINLGNSRFFFSVENSHQDQAGAASRRPGQFSKHKSPSDRKRDALRRERFLDKKRNSSPPGAPETSSNISNNPVDNAKVSAIPVTETSNSGKGEAMDTTEDKHVPEISSRNESKETTIASQLDLPTAISPINSPIKEINSIEEVHLIFCAKDQIEASKLVNKLESFPSTSIRELKPEYVRLQTKRNRHHFLFSSLVNSKDIEDLKDKIDLINVGANVIQFRVLSLNQNCYPNEPNHCRECQVKHCKK